jgi:hypothetical protein
MTIYFFMRSVDLLRCVREWPKHDNKNRAGRCADRRQIAGLHHAACVRDPQAVSEHNPRLPAARAWMAQGGVLVLY